MLNCNLLSLFLLLLVCTAQAQTEPGDLLIDALKRNLAKHEALEMEQNAQKLLQYSKEEENTAMQLEAIKYMGIAQHLQARYDSAIYWNNKGLELATQINDSTNMAKCYLNIATSYNSKGDFENAVKNALKAEKGFEAIDDKNGQGACAKSFGCFLLQTQRLRNSIQLL